MTSKALKDDFEKASDPPARQGVREVLPLSEGAVVAGGRRREVDLESYEDSSMSMVMQDEMEPRKLPQAN